MTELTARQALVAKLRSGLRPDQLRTEDLDGFRHDRSGWTPPGAPTAVVFPENTVDVQEILRSANELAVPVVVRGTGTGLSGAATAVAGELVLSTARLTAITELSPADQLAVVQPGVITAALDKAAGEHGLRYPPDPASVGISTIGGNIATNAGGLRCAKYGVTRDSILGLDVVLADGQVISTGRRTVKGVTGYDLTSLFIGSEGTLGVVVSATVRLRPIPAAPTTLVAFFDTVATAAGAVNEILLAGIQPAVAELLDYAALAAIDSVQGTDFLASGHALLLIQTDGAGARIEADSAERLLAGSARSVERTEDPVRAEDLLRARKLALPSLEAKGRVLIEDIAVPRSRIADAIAAVTEIAAGHDVSVATLGHAGDGNLHPIFVIDPAEPEVPAPVWAAAGEIFGMALEFGGTLTGEHGVGLLKRRWLADELGESNLTLQRQLKLLFDPREILNPGKAL